MKFDKTHILGYSFVLLSILVFLFVVLPEKENYYLGLLEYRKTKDYFLKFSDNSPLENKLKVDFENAQYFAIDKRYRVEAGVRFYDQPDTLEMKIAGSYKNEKDYFVRYGKVVFELDGEAVKLDFFKQIGELQSDYYFLPFYDYTNGMTSFEKGRYIDFKIDTSKVIQKIDFNLAYNPFCAYNFNYRCPIPPKTNSIPNFIEAGEMKFGE